MVVLTVVARENPCTVYFDEPLPKTDLVRLVSCSLPYSWLNVKTSGRISLRNNQNKVFSEKGFPPGHYTPTVLAKNLNSVFTELNTKITAEANTPTGALVIKNPEFEKVQFPSNLLDFLCRQNWRLADLLIPKLNSPCVYFVYCDLVVPAHNLINGKKSNLLAMFDIRGKPVQKAHYQTGEQQDFRDASTGKHLNNVTLSVKDVDGELFDFRGQKLTFELAIN